MGAKLEECSLYQVSFGGWHTPMFVIASSYDKAEQKAVAKRLAETPDSLLTADGSLNVESKTKVPEVKSITLISKEIIF